MMRPNKNNFECEITNDLKSIEIHKILLFKLFRCGILFLLAITLFLGSTLFGVDEYSKSTCTLLTVAKGKLNKVEKQREKYKKTAIAKFIKSLQGQQDKLTKAANLDGAIAVRDMITKIKDSDYDSVISSEIDDAPKESKSQVSKFLKYDKKIKKYYKDNKGIIIQELLELLKKQFLLYKKSKLVSNAVSTKDLIKIVKDEDFSLLDYEFAVKKKVKRVITKDDKAKEIKKPSLEGKIILTSFKIGNNILTEDANDGKGRILVYFAESLDSSNEDIKLLRKKIEKGLYITVVPCNMSEDMLREVLVEEINTLVGYKEANPMVQSYCALLKYLDKNYKFNPVVANYINKYNLNMNLKHVLKIDNDLFGGSLEADTIRMQIDTGDSVNIAKSLQKAERLGLKYPKNLDVAKLVSDLKLSYKKIKESKIKDSKITTRRDVDCSNCNHSGWIEVECDACKGKDDQVCASCIGSGICYKKVECSECSGKGSNWLGISCKKCQGTGLIKERSKCPVCKGTGKCTCKKCNGTRKVRIKCPKCNGSGKIKQ